MRYLAECWHSALPHCVVASKFKECPSGQGLLLWVIRDKALRAMRTGGFRVVEGEARAEWHYLKVNVRTLIDHSSSPAKGRCLRKQTEGYD